MTINSQTQQRCSVRRRGQKAAAAKKGGAGGILDFMAPVKSDLIGHQARSEGLAAKKRDNSKAGTAAVAQAAVTRRRRHAWVGSRRIRDVNMHALQSIFRRASRFSAGTPSLHVRCQDVNNDARRGGFARRVRRNVDVGCVRFTGDTRRSRREGASRVARRALGASARSAARDERARRGQRYGEQSRFIARRMSKQSGSTGISSSEFRHLRNSYGVSLARMDHPVENRQRSLGVIDKQAVFLSIRI